MNVLLVGAGRMGLRHFRGLVEIDGEVYVVDLRREAEKDLRRAAAEHAAKAKVSFCSSLCEVPFGKIQLDAAILSETAQGRLDRFRFLVDHGIKNILIEKPLEQSRKRFHELLRVAQDNKLQVRCNHYRRSLPFYAQLRERGGPFQIIVTGGAFGLGCNGVHWLDLAAYLAKSRSAEMLFGEIEATEIASGRGPAFRDYGGRGLFAFEDGSRLFLSCSADSSASAVAMITLPDWQCVVDLNQDLAIVCERDPASANPNYLYGVDYSRREVRGIESVQFSELTKGWIHWLQGHGKCPLPSLEEAALGHELLFDLLGTSGETEFAIT